MACRKFTVGGVAVPLLTALEEYHENTDPLTIDNVEINQVVNIFACKNIIVIIKGKVNAVTLGA
jgi:hypothetical protein